MGYCLLYTITLPFCIRSGVRGQCSAFWGNIGRIRIYVLWIQIGRKGKGEGEEERRKGFPLSMDILLCIVGWDEGWDLSVDRLQCRW